MSCYKPLSAWRHKSKLNKNNKTIIKFKPPDWRSRSLYEYILIGCGRCVGCRLDRSRMWALRCVNESELYDENCFITLTYNDDHLPEDGSLRKRDFQLFMKRFRRRYGNDKIRFFHCGEYGELCEHCGKHKEACGRYGCGDFKAVIGRPHYHACIFNFDFADKDLWKVRDGVKLYTSKELDGLWSDNNGSMGYTTIGDVTFESAAYIARYNLKQDELKLYGEMADKYYGKRVRPYVTMSRRPGIGREFFEKYKDEIYATDSVLFRKGVSVKPARYYDKLYDLHNPEHYAIIKEVRKEDMLKDPDYFNDKRREVKHQIKLKSSKLLKRGMENETECVLCV